MPEDVRTIQRSLRDRIKRAGRKGHSIHETFNDFDADGDGLIGGKICFAPYLSPLFFLCS